MHYFIYGSLGLVSGLLFYYLALHHVKVRSEYDNGEKLNKIKNKKYILVWMFSAMLLFLLVAWRGMGCWQTIRLLIFTLFAFNVSAVDILLRRIPNSVLLGMAVLQMINIGVEISQGADAISTILPAIISAFMAYIIFVVPAMLKLSVGAGDVKYSIVIGFMLGFFNYTVAMVVMAIAELVYYAYLKATKTGNMKTAAPMAPFLSIGAFVAMIFPVF